MYIEVHTTYVQIISISKFTLFIYCSKLKNALNVFSFGNASANNVYVYGTFVQRPRPKS